MVKRNKKEIILGIDPGFGKTGFGVIENSSGEWKLVACGCIETEINDPFVERLVELHLELLKVIKKYKPTRVSVEDLFFARNVTTAIKVGQARGVILLTVAQLKIPVEEYTPLQVKQAITGYGRAEKGQIQRMIQMQFRLKKKITPDDAADAVAVALTCAASLNLKRRLKNNVVK
ncbi:MAG TPA: crossover junction endodeoxyribonuclease RuvC [Candidatus Magasanikbacteria bacterium]|jgi:crossover junction endodeoxyribonuclease RuvC|nr:crossover junction endodeoxyribonuclease RuvC [Candidatus Magasanikbacteria bacterium]HQF57058.1 crossover junction endodeoxyribonuclease RuvC [Candidatus Magasanikbacteria bacterium]